MEIGSKAAKLILSRIEQYSSLKYQNIKNNRGDNELASKTIDKLNNDLDKYKVIRLKTSLIFTDSK